MSDVLARISEELQNGKAKIVKQLVEDALAEGISAQNILTDGLMAGLDVIAVKFKNNEVYVPEMLVAARAMNMGTSTLKPYLIESGVKPIGKALLGTVKGDLHDIGKNLVKIMFEGKGIEVIDLGVDVPPEEFIRVQKDENADIIALSALLTTTMDEMKVTIDAFKDAGMRDDVIIMVGGAPVSESIKESSGADLYADDAATAAELAMNALTAKS